MKINKYAGIDIGSNGVRLLIMNVYQKDGQIYYDKNILVRAPIRLGSDSFVHNEIKEDTIHKLVLAMISFRNLMTIYGVSKYRAVATSALREALNGQYVINRVFDESEVKIELIDGKEEADIIYRTQIDSMLKQNQGYLFIDVGGGSTEVTYYYNKKAIASQSFKIGTVRSLKNLVEMSEWDHIVHFLEQLNISPKAIAVGTGGNINTVFKYSKKSLGAYLTLNYLIDQYRELKKLTVDQRILKYGFNPDRADVIVPALEIYTFIMKKSKLKHMLVPKFGLADGLIKSLEYDS